jgi:predicted RND superfamily exporter protein
LNYLIIGRVTILNELSERRKRLHDLLLTLINKDNEFKFIEEDSSDLTSSYSEKDTVNLSRVIEKNRKIIKRYQALVRTAVTLDALMDSENEENYKIT